jgi:ABC-type phosphate transport system substrate-binding protein
MANQMKRSSGMKQKILMRLILTVFIGTLFALPYPEWSAVAAASDVQIIVNNRVPDDTLSQTDIRQIFLGQKSQWNDGTRINIVTSDQNDLTRDFLNEYVGRTPAQFSNYWKKLVFTGKGRMPRSFKTDKSLVEHVAATEGAIGYISAEERPDGVKVITISD